MMIDKIIPCADYFDTTSWEQTNQNAIKVPKVLKIV